MAEELPPPPAEATPDTPPVVEVRRRRRWSNVVLQLFLGLVALLVIAVAVLNSPIGHRFVADRIASYAPASGLRVTVGRIEGSLFGETLLRDVAFADPQGVFLRVPSIELDWRPLNWFASGLDVRKFVAHRGTLTRFPKLNPGDPDAPLLPDFDIRVDQFKIDNLTVAKGVIGEQRRVDLDSKVDIRQGRALIRADGRFGGADRVIALLDVAPDNDRFDIRLDYTAPRGGVLAGLTGAQRGIDMRIRGQGGWKRWDGAFLAREEGRDLAAFKLGNRSGRYSLLGLAWPGDWLSGIPARAAGQAVAIGAEGTLESSVLRGKLDAYGAGLAVHANGTTDLNDNSFDQMRVSADLLDPDLLGTRIEGGRVTALLDGAFRDLTVDHTFSASRVVAGGYRIERVSHKGIATYDGTRWTLPIDLAAARVLTGDPTADRRLVNPRATATVYLTGNRLHSDDIRLNIPGLAARLVLRGDTAKGGYAVAGNAAARGFPLPDLGLADADAKLVASLNAQGMWTLRTNLAGRMARVDNDTLTTVAGTRIRFAGSLSMGSNRPLLVERARIDGSKLTLAISGRMLPGGTATITGSGRHADYGPFKVDASVAGDGPRAVLVFASPYPAAGLKDVRVAISPIPEGFRIETGGGSSFGPFEGVLGLFSKPGGPTRIEIETMKVWQTTITGALTLGGNAVTGQLQLAGGGVSGTVALGPRGGGQGLDVQLTASNARFGGDTPIAIRQGTLNATGFFAKDRTTLQGDLQARGIGVGTMFIGRLAAKANLDNGRGRVTASLAGRRGSRFNLQLVSDFDPGRVAVLAQGDFAGRAIVMPRRAVLTRQGSGWELAPSQVNFGGGRMIASGRFGGGATDLRLALADMPLSLVDIFTADMGLGGTASGVVEYRQAGLAPPTGEVRVMVKGLSRSGLVLTSRPVDLALVGRLDRSELEARAVVREGADTRGRLQARLSGLPDSGDFMTRLRAGRLLAQLRYDGPADALWRLAGIETFDLTGPMAVSANVTGTLAEPQIAGSIATETLRLSSSLIGAAITDIKARGRFSGSRLELTSFSGKAGDGRISGSGTFDLSDLGAKGPGMDIRLAAKDARVLARQDIGATVTGPIRIVSDGVNGVIAGRVRIERARWALGQASGAAALPDVRTREINARFDVAPQSTTRMVWRYLIDADGENRINVRGLGLDSEWGANIKLRGTVDAPAIQGRADLVRGAYEFAGKRFELTRGIIYFDGGSPPDPRLDIAAEFEETGLTARVTVQGTASRPDIAFTSTPALPEEELLSRLLFGNSVTDISAPEALQLGAALASLRGGGGGLDPINKLRSAIGLDRLRIVPADPATDRETAIAVGKYFGRRFYAELVTDGKGYSATSLEFRITRWLSLLASVSSVGHQNVGVKASKDY